MLADVNVAFVVRPPADRDTFKTAGCNLPILLS